MKQSTKGHTYIKLFHRSFVTIYRHYLYKRKIANSEKLIFKKKNELDIIPLTSSILDKVCDCFFDTNKIKHFLLNKNYFGFAIVNNDIVIGFITYCFPTFSTEQYRIVNTSAFIDKLWIDVNYRGNRLSEYLIDYCVYNVAMTGKNEVSLVVRRNNVSMLRVLNRLPFERVRRIKSIRFCGLNIFCPKI